MPEQRNGHPVEGEPIQVEDSGVLQALTTSEINVQIATAKKYPRSIQAFQREALALATLDQETAKSMYYRVPRDGKYIEGGSVRLAEICGSAWGNCHVGARVVDIDDKFVTSQAIAWDLEKNFKVAVEIRRGITNKYGRRYSDDMIRTTAQAAMSVALRNAIFRIVSPALVKSVLEEAKKVSLGKGMTMEQRRERAFKAMVSVGAKEKDILRVLGKRGLEDIDVDDLINLNGMYTAIKDGETSWATILSEFQQSQPKNDEDIKRDLKTDFDDAEVVEKEVVERKEEDKQPGDGIEIGEESGASAPAADNEERFGDELNEQELNMLYKLFGMAPGKFKDKVAAVQKAVPEFVGKMEIIRPSQVEAVSAILAGL